MSTERGTVPRNVIQDAGKNRRRPRRQLDREGADVMPGTDKVGGRRAGDDGEVAPGGPGGVPGWTETEHPRVGPAIRPVLALLPYLRHAGLGGTATAGGPEHRQETADENEDQQRGLAHRDRGW